MCMSKRLHTWPGARLLLSMAPGNATEKWRASSLLRLESSTSSFADFTSERDFSSRSTGDRRLRSPHEGEADFPEVLFGQALSAADLRCTPPPVESRDDDFFPWSAFFLTGRSNSLSPPPPSGSIDALFAFSAAPLVTLTEQRRTACRPCVKALGDAAKSLPTTRPRRATRKCCARGGAPVLLFLRGRVSRNKVGRPVGTTKRGEYHGLVYIIAGG